MADPKQPYHSAVMRSECVGGLRIVPTQTYVDATFGGGGHSLAILDRLKGGRLIAFDQDEAAEKEAAGIRHPSFTFCHANFMYMKEYLKLNGVHKVNGVLADLGVSSHQLDTPERGFSTRSSGPLDMRMDQHIELTAARLLNEYDVRDLQHILGTYGEIRNARAAARRIAAYRNEKKFRETGDLKEALKDLAPAGKENKYFAQVFQALRIEVNEELVALEKFLGQCVEVVDIGGRVVILTYHSLEDRMVKNLFSKGRVRGEAEKDIYGNVRRPFLAVLRKPLTPSREEIKNNPRARSAKMRIGERIAE